MVTIFDQARKTEAKKSKAKSKATSKARGRSRNDVCKMLPDRDDKEMLLHWLRLGVKMLMEHGLKYFLWRKWKLGDVDLVMGDVKLEDFDQMQEFIDHLCENVFGDGQYMVLVLGRIDESLEHAEAWHTSTHEGYATG